MQLARIALLFLLAQCSKEPNCKNEIYPDGRPNKVDGPSTGTVGKPVTKEVTFAVHNGCGAFSQFSETNSSQNREITIFASYPPCQICTQDLPLRKESYTFTPQTPGTYILNFVGPNTRLSDTIVVN